MGSNLHCDTKAKLKPTGKGGMMDLHHVSVVLGSHEIVKHVLYMFNDGELIKL